jgi:hypothetical protein
MTRQLVQFFFSKCSSHGHRHQLALAIEDCDWIDLSQHRLILPRGGVYLPGKALPACCDGPHQQVLFGCLRLISWLMLFYYERNIILWLISRTDKYKWTRPSHRSQCRLCGCVPITSCRSYYQAWMNCPRLNTILLLLYEIKDILSKILLMMCCHLMLSSNGQNLSPDRGRLVGLPSALAPII